MADVRLLDLATIHFRVELTGPVRQLPSASGEDCQAAFDVRLSGSDEIQHCTVRLPDGSYSSWADGQPGPLLSEDTNYRLTVEALDTTQEVTIRHRDPQLIESIGVVTGHPSLRSGTLNFRRQVGRSVLHLASGDRHLALTVEIFPSKIDYQTDYEALIHDLYNITHGLALEYLRATYRSASSEPVPPTSSIEWLTLLAQHVDDLERALAYIAVHPHRTLLLANITRRAESIKRPGHATVRAIAKGQGQGAWINVPGLGRVHSSLPAVHPSETLDNPEHAWLRQQIRDLSLKLGEILASLERERTNLRNAQRSTTRLTAEIDELSAIAMRMTNWLDLAPLANVSAPHVQPGFTSLTLIGQPGYREAYHALLILRTALSLHGGALQASIKDLDVLYESWCFVKVVVTTSTLLGGAIDPADLLEVRDEGIRVRLRRGHRSSVRLHNSNRILTVRYGQDFDGLTGRQSPDIVLEFRDADWPPIIIILDAKYRLDTSGRYLSAFSTPGPPIDAINALHRYRDAITLKMSESGIGRPVVRGAALFPLTFENPNGFKEHKLWRSLEQLGIGAIPLLPGNSSLLEEWLTAVLALDPATLACPGPPFMAWEHSRSTPERQTYTIRCPPPT